MRGRKRLVSGTQFAPSDVGLPPELLGQVLAAVDAGYSKGRFKRLRLVCRAWCAAIDAAVKSVSITLAPEALRGNMAHFHGATSLQLLQLPPDGNADDVHSVRDPLAALLRTCAGCPRLQAMHLVYHAKAFHAATELTQLTHLVLKCPYIPPKGAVRAGPQFSKPARSFGAALAHLTRLHTLHLEQLDAPTAAAAHELAQALASLASLRVLLLDNCTFRQEAPHERCAQLTALECRARRSQPAPRLGALAALRSLTLERVDTSLLDCTLPSTLTHLDLSTRGREWGSVRQALPESVSTLTGLEVLRLHSHTLERLPLALSHCGALRTLLLNGQGSTGDFPAVLLACRHLRRLELSGQFMSALPTGVADLSHLTSLRLAGVFDELMPAAIAPQFEPLQFLGSLRELRLSQNGLESLGQWVSRLVHLTLLDLQANRLESLPASISSLSNLQQLDLSENHMRQLPDVLWTLSALLALDLSTNSLIPAVLPVDLSRLTRLTHLGVQNIGLTELPGALSTLSSLEHLDAACNDLEARHLSAVLPLRALTTLVLDECERIDCLPEGLSRLRSLRQLHLVYLPRLTALPASLTQLSALEVLYLRAATGFAGVLPEGLDAMQRLREVQLPLMCPGADRLQTWVAARGGSAGLQLQCGLSVMFHGDE